eukprot:766284-Hanusia_phi.AAC.3
MPVPGSDELELAPVESCRLHVSFKLLSLRQLDRAERLPRLKQTVTSVSPGESEREIVAACHCAGATARVSRP